MKRSSDSPSPGLTTSTEAVAHENHEEHSDMQGAFQYIQEQNQVSDVYNKRAQHRAEENKTLMNVADELQTKMLMLQDENSNMLEIAQREREKQWSTEMRHTVLTNEAAESSDQHYQEKRMIEYLRAQLALVKGSEMSTIAEMGSQDVEQKTEIQACKLEAREREMRAQQFQE